VMAHLGLPVSDGRMETGDDIFVRILGARA
jgi:hypothetical protein